MSNVRKSGGGGEVPSELRLPGVTGDLKMPPETIKGEMASASGKAKMNFKHPPLGPEQHYTDGEAADVAMGEDGPEKEGGKLQGTGKSKIKHRSTSGAQGHGIVGN